MPPTVVPPIKSASRQPASRRGSATAIDFLQRHETGAGLLPAAQRLLRLRDDLLALMPRSLNGVCDVGSFDDDVVVLRVFSAGAAAKLRQTLPRLKDGLAERGWNVSAIRMRVQPRASPEVAATWKAVSTTEIPSSGVAAFDVLQRELEESPLRAAVERLLRRRAR